MGHAFVAVGSFHIILNPDPDKAEHNSIPALFYREVVSVSMKTKDGGVSMPRSDDALVGEVEALQLFNQEFHIALYYGVRNPTVVGLNDVDWSLMAVKEIIEVSVVEVGEYRDLQLHW